MKTEDGERVEKMDKTQSVRRTLTKESLGVWYGILGVVIFSVTLPASKMAVGAFGSLIVGPGRALIAAVFAALALSITRQPLPPRRYWRRLMIVTVGAIFGFPLLTAWAMARVPASHGAVVLALLPLATAGVAALRNGERPSAWFWFFSLGAAATVLVYAFSQGFSHMQWPDLALVGAVVMAALAYAEGGRMAGDLGGWQVIAWAIVLSVPALILMVGWTVWTHHGLGHGASIRDWVALLYLAIGSQFVGFVAWYHGMRLGGVARVSQMQYLQPFFTLVFSWVLVGERLTLSTVVASVVCVGWVAMGKRAVIYSAVSPDTRATGDSA